jgi:hypothetical protein
MLTGAVLATIILLLPSDAHAYVDPGTGSMVLQLVIAGLVSGLYMIKRFWSNIKSFVCRDSDHTPES